jgi:catechol 2,3-dioxygenase-like lactoylglutathione lyase family enzyme
VLATSAVIAFASTTDLARARTLYEAALGLRVVDETPMPACSMPMARCCELLPSPGSPTPATPCSAGVLPTSARPSPTLNPGGGSVFTRYDGMAQGAQGVWTSPNGDRIAWCTDPDGNVLSLRVHMTAGGW